MQFAQTLAPFLLIWFVVINLVAVMSFWIDKARSISGGWRIRESTLLSIAFWGGSLGALAAQQWFRHKTTKEPFRSRLNHIAMLHIFIGVVFLIPPIRVPILEMLDAILAELRSIQ